MEPKRLAEWLESFHERELADVSGDVVRVWRCRSVEFGASTLEMLRVGEAGAVHQRTDHAKRTPEISLSDVIAQLDTLGFWELDADSSHLVFGTTEEWLVEARRGEQQRTVYRLVFDERDAALERFLRDLMKRARV